MSGTEWWVVGDGLPADELSRFVGRSSLNGDIGWVGYEHAYTFASRAAAVETAERFGGTPFRIVR